MLGHIDGHFSQEDLATLPQQILVWQPVPTVVHLLYLVQYVTVTHNEGKLDVSSSHNNILIVSALDESVM